MKIAQAAFAAVLAAAVCGCSTPQKKTVSGVGVSGAPVAIIIAPSPAASGLSAMTLEPLGCARLASSDGQPVFDAQELNCIVGWVRSAQDYLYRGGTPTKYTNEAEFNIMKKTALDMMAAQTKWLNGAKFEAKADRAVASAVYGSTGPHSSSQSYLDGVIAYQKGDYIQARAAWTDALKLDPSNADAQAGLDKLDKDGAR